MIFKTKYFLSVLFFGLAAILISQGDVPISVSSQVDKARIRIGDLIHYSVTVIYNDSVQVEMPGFAANLSGFEIRDYELKEPQEKDGQLVTEASYTISTFLTGEFEIPPLFIQYTMGSDTTRHALMTESIKITVESMKASEAGDIRDVKAPLEIPRNWWYLLRWGILGILLISALFTGIILYRRYKAGKSFLPVREVPPRPAHEVAIESLNHLLASDLWAEGEIKQFYIELSEIIREYINGRYFVVALEMTTTEVLYGLRAQDLTDEIFNLFQTFLQNCDLVKFAKFIPSDELHEGNVKTAYEIVEKTKPVIVVHEEISDSDQSEEMSQESIQDSAETAEPESVSKENEKVHV
ncbi:hypothetical protein JW835_16070 [bacterium]|nr:hypothetical protein [bacterium]